ncbi:MAG: metallophosphoesterase family protein [Candidatus Hydrogenedentes bacterium]|nr:metallophosphoesterase family protein [Candidatus Hydrogenedentota bacterium]
MILGVISDTHRNTGLMHRAAKLLINDLHAVHIIHLGDDYADKEALEGKGYPITGVPGLWCPEYNDPHVPNMVIEDIEGVRIAYAHSADDLPPLTCDLNLCLMGHTHHYGIVVRQGIPMMNPGHLKAGLDRMRYPSVGLMDISSTVLHLSIHDLEGQIFMEQDFPRSTPELKPA